ncbi:MAG: CocE/NonD family hydrolase [Paraglaciecola sp.]|uniref:CocE/NonD family hydrolase n=1 Tax=Paraglaciecola sp. TaxID=1920173 RepID=UPI0032975783
MTKEKSALYWIQGFSPEAVGYPGLNPRTETENGITIDYDVAVPMRDGINIRINIYRPEKEGRYPVIIAWGPYGKHGFVKYDMLPGCGQPQTDLSKHCGFEAPDPAYYCAHDYIIIYADPRGSWGSQGDLSFYSQQEAEDFYDLIEWSAVQPWSTGKVGTSGVSYLSWSQWRVASLNPPHLAAINPWEGVSDFYREMHFHGGIEETEAFSFKHLGPFWGQSHNNIEDLGALVKENPLWNEKWAAKNSDLANITVPAYVAASWSDTGLHLRGSLEGFKQIASKDKWLRVHGRMKWPEFHQQIDSQRQFFDKFLKGIDSEVDYWPKVNLEVRERYFVGNYRGENEWPLARTQYTPLYLNTADGTMQDFPIAISSQARYNADNQDDKSQNISFVYEFKQETEITGHMKLRVWVQADGNDDMDVFVAVEKINRSGDIVHFPFFTSHDDGPVALGWLRASHREQDEEKSRDYQPIYKHERQIKLQPGERVPLDIEILPSCTLFQAGEKLQITLQGSDIYYYDPPPMGGMPLGHKNLINKGEHVIHTGGEHDSYLLVPIIPKA